MTRLFTKGNMNIKRTHEIILNKSKVYIFEIFKFSINFEQIKQMSILLISLGFVCCIVGFIGSILPALPGLPVSWLGLLLLYLAPDVDMSTRLLWITLGITILIFILDYVIPVLGTKKFGGSRYGMYGAGIGLVVGIIVPVPLGFIIGAFLGAYLGEILFSRQDSNKALRAAWGSFIGFLASTFVEAVAALSFFILFIYQVIQYREFLF